MTTGSQVETGAPLVRLEPVGGRRRRRARSRPTAGADLDLPDGATTGRRPRRARGARPAATCSAVVLGYDVTAGRPGRPRCRVPRAPARSSRPRRRRRSSDEIELLDLFADLAELSRNRPADEERHTELRVHSSREHFHTYLQSLDVERGGLPGAVPRAAGRGAAPLRRRRDLDRTPELEEAVFRIFLAQQRVRPRGRARLRPARRWIVEPPPTGELAGRARELLDRLGRATQLRFPVVGDLARSVRFRWFDQPLVDAERADVLGRRARRARGARRRRRPRRPGRPDRGARRDPRADRAVPRRAARATASPTREPMLEVLARRHYREYDLHDLRVARRGRRPDRPWSADYTLDERPTRLVSTIGTVAELADGTELARPRRSPTRSPTGAEGHEAVVDLYLHWPDAPGVAGGGQRARSRPLVAALPFAARRTPVAVARVPGRRRAGRLLHLPPAAGDGGRWSRTT